MADPYGVPGDADVKTVYTASGHAAGGHGGPRSVTGTVPVRGGLGAHTNFSVSASASEAESEAAQPSQSQGSSAAAGSSHGPGHANAAVVGTNPFQPEVPATYHGHPVRAPANRTLHL